MVLFLVTTICERASRRLLFDDPTNAFQYAVSEKELGDGEVWITIFRNREYGIHGSLIIDENFQI